MSAYTQPTTLAAFVFGMRQALASHEGTVRRVVMMWPIALPWSMGWTFAVLLTLSIPADPALSAPRSEALSRAAPAPSAVAPGSPLVPPTPRAAPTGVGEALVDRNGNRIADGLEARLEAANPDARIDIAVGFATPEEAEAALRRLGAVTLRHTFELVPGFSATMTVGQARALVQMPGVVRVEEVFPVSTQMEAARRDFGADRAAALGYTGAGVGICVVDTGIFAEHELFMEGGLSKVDGFFDFVNGKLAPYDDHGHGTHVASIAAGDGTGGDEFAPRYRGVAPAARLHGAKVLDAAGQGTSDTVIAGVNWCANQPGVHIINLSLGSAGSSDGQDLLSQTVNAAVDRGKVVVVAAGNGGAAPRTIGSPAAAARALTVGAAAEWSASTLAEGESDGLYIAPWSSRGPTADGRVKPDLVAPGHTIIAGYIDPSGIGLFGCTDDCYASLSGTSMATPFAAGTVALMLEADPTLTPDGVHAILFATAQDRGPQDRKGKAMQDHDWGYGLLDSYAAVARAAGAVEVTPTAFPAYLYGTDSVRGSAPTRISIAVTDPNAPLAVTITILNGGPRLFCSLFLGCWYEWRPDYDVRLLDPNGTEVAIGICMLGAWYGLECDNVGRQETVHVANPVVGTYTLEVYKGTRDSKNGPFSYEVSRGPVGAPGW